VEPIAPKATAAGVTLTPATTCDTVTVTAEEETLPEDAVTCVVPFPAAVTRPLPFTVATEGLLELHVMGADAIVAPAASRATAVNCAVRVSV